MVNLPGTWGEKNFFELWLLVAVSSFVKLIMKPVQRAKLVQVSTKLWSRCGVLSGISIYIITQVILAF